MYKQHNIKTTTNAVSYFLQFHTLDTVEEEVDLGVTVDNKLKFSKHVDTKISKANKLLGLIRHTFKFLNADTLTLLYKSLIRPHVEYATPVWSPHLKGDRDKIEKLQRRATKLVPELKDKPYNERLQTLKLPTLEYRRLRADLILLYKYSHNLIKLDTNTQCPQCRYSTNMLQPSLSASHRGHNLKYQIHHHTGVRGRFFTSRTLNTWNKLHTTTVNANTVNTFKSKLDSDGSLPDRYAYKF
jgi:hypothetical protein